MTGHDLDGALRVAVELAEWASETIRGGKGGAGGPVRQKASPADIVTDTDEAVETHVRSVLRREYPEWGIDGEEYGAQEGASGAPHWVIDPVDGTTNYAHGIGWCSFSLGLAEQDGSPLLGVVADPWRREVFTAVRGGGAHLNGVPIHAAGHTTLTGHVFMTEWAAHAHWAGLDTLLAQLSARHCTARVMGSTALSLAQVAAGRATAAAIGEFHPVDGLPALLIATEAGAVAIPQLPAYDEPLLLVAPGAAEEALELWRTTVGRKGAAS
ncbi:inositol monophosphatase family protein [Streptomyces pseudovenezuelae]|uniref:Myo-inositol-1(Or 4)-monophosphatase n=1 Tax=Streptomyces pseudovenezuelae TaxID=67350 RepID=A0ABT6LX08_9ACTN|nr:inositol monophosphatase family protein [Streptomyces pseudovenezuelae]MDH6220390.1 myo-inositol-1(or 4)-monophosphatase [Streptomyces pseudovenezuelae]